MTTYRELDVEVESGQPICCFKVNFLTSLVGMLDGQEIVFYGEGEPHVDGINNQYSHFKQ